MNRTWYVAYRLAWAAFASAVVTVVLFVLAKSAPYLAAEAVDSPRVALPAVENEFWNAADPAYRQYLDWLHSLVTLQWGTSMRFGEPIAGLLGERAAITLAYFVPAVVLGTAIATVLGYAAAARQGGLIDRLSRGSAVFVLAVPNFVIGAAFARYLRRRSFMLGAHSYDPEAAIFEEWNLVWLAAAATIMGTHVTATQLRQVRAQSTDHLAADFTTVVRAKGRGPIGVARHVLKAAAAPLASLFVAETVGLLAVSVFVIEAVLEVPGVGYVAWQAAGVNDAPLVMIVTLLVAVLIILASVAEDLLAVVFDPRLLDED